MQAEQLVGALNAIVLAHVQGVSSDLKMPVKFERAQQIADKATYELLKTLALSNLSFDYIRDMIINGP